MTKVFIAPGDSYHAAINMFERAGFEVVKDYQEVDLICFLGGTDVDPAIYGEERGPHTQSPDRQRDEVEVALFRKFLDVPKVGICRGGQLLNVLNGGKMIQHLGKTISGDVQVFVAANLARDDEHRIMRVDHHQGMLAANDIGNGLLSWNERDDEDDYKMWPDYAIVYEDTKSLCFQPHPEWGHKGTEDYFFELIEKYFGFSRKAV